MGVIGLLGYMLIRANIPLTPIILGLVLGPTLEKEFRTAMIMSEGRLEVFYTSPVALVFFGLTALIIGRQLWAGISDRRKRRGDELPGQKSQA
jgi:putative tricarboxylic transport membrane protein